MRYKWAVVLMLWAICFCNYADRQAIFSVFPLLALAIFLAQPKPLTLVMIGGVAQALMLPLIAGATLYLRYRDADSRVGPSKLSDALTWIAFAGSSPIK